MTRKVIISAPYPSRGRPVFIAIQCPPLSVERKTPKVPVPAYTVAGVRGLMAREPTPLSVRPVFTAVHVVPLSVERKTPLEVPAYRVVGVRGSMARERILQPGTESILVHVLPLLTERERKLPKTPWVYKVEGETGSIARTEILPPYSGSCVHIPVSAACAAGTPTNTPERLRARHKARITMMDRYLNHFCVLNCFIPLLLLEVPRTCVNPRFWFSSLPEPWRVLGRRASTYHTFPEARNGLSAYLKCEIGRIAPGLDKFEEPRITCNVKSLRAPHIHINRILRPRRIGSLYDYSCWINQWRYLKCFFRSVGNSDLVDHSVVSAQYDVTCRSWTAWTVRRRVSYSCFIFADRRLWVSTPPWQYK